MHPASRRRRRACCRSHSARRPGSSSRRRESVWSCSLRSTFDEFTVLVQRFLCALELQIRLLEFLLARGEHCIADNGYDGADDESREPGVHGLRESSGGRNQKKQKSCETNGSAHCDAGDTFLHAVKTVGNLGSRERQFFPHERRKVIHQAAQQADRTAAVTIT